MLKSQLPMNRPSIREFLLKRVKYEIGLGKPNRPIGEPDRPIGEPDRPMSTSPKKVEPTPRVGP